MAAVDYQPGATTCPKCGATATVRGTKRLTARVYVRQMRCDDEGCRYTFQALGPATRHTRKPPEPPERRIGSFFG